MRAIKMIFKISKKMKLNSQIVNQINKMILIRNNLAKKIKNQKQKI